MAKKKAFTQAQRRVGGMIGGVKGGRRVQELGTGHQLTQEDRARGGRNSLKNPRAHRFDSEGGRAAVAERWRRFAALPLAEQEAIREMWRRRRAAKRDAS